MKEKCILLVVLYNHTALTSSTIRTFINECSNYHSKVILEVWDNSPVSQECIVEKEIPSTINYRYRKGNNTSLSIIYNCIAREYPNSIIHIFDQDSGLNNDYFNKTYTALHDHSNINLFIPLIKQRDCIVSPAIRHLHRGKFYSDIHPGVHSSNRLLCITSGMTLRTNYINSENSFDENLNFYGIDSKFCLDYSKKNKLYYLVDYTLVHSLSKYEKENFKKKLWRLNNHNKASLYISQKISPLCFIACCLGCIRQYVKLLLRIS